ncbi:MAG: glycosyltransferase family 4 protein, partial [Thermodesulfobacteriota bacterium]
MNIGVVTNGLEDHGGAEVYLLECLRRWQEKAEITLYAPSLNEALLKEYGVDLHRIAYVKLTSLNAEERRFDLIEDLRVLPRLWEQMLRAHDAYFLNGFPLHFTRCHPAVFMCHEPLRMLYDLRYQHQHLHRNSQTTVHVYPEQRYRKVSARDMEVQLGLIEAVDRGSSFSHLVANSRAMSRYVGNVYGREADTIVHPGINLPNTVTDPSPGKRAIYVGRLWYHKRVDLLVRAIAHIEEGFLDIVGKGPERESLETLAEELGVAHRVVFHGSLSNDELAACYEQATCGAYMSVREPFGIMPIEAAAAGRPVIASPDGGYTELLSSDAAFFVPPNPAAIARAMHQLFEDPKLAKRMGALAREQV